MSLVSLFAKGEDIVDAGLDAIFKSSAGPSLFTNSPLEINLPGSSSSKVADKGQQNGTNSGNATLKSTSKRKAVVNQSGKDDRKKKKLGGTGENERDAKVIGSANISDSFRGSPSKVAVSSDVNSKGNKKGKKKATDVEVTNNESQPEDSDSNNNLTHYDSDSEEGETNSLPLHESLKTAQSRSSKPKKLVYKPEGETTAQRNARTIFIGNIPLEVAKSNSQTKQLKQHIKSALPTAKIESIRFRSVAFKTPTSRIDSDSNPIHTDTPSTKQQRQQQRAATWREEQDKVEDKASEKRYLKPEEKRRIAFITGDFNEKADSMNAYVVFAHPVPEVLRPPNLPKQNVMDPYDAARLAVERLSGTVFLTRTIRVDLAHREDEWADGDPKMTLFVGNLDFATKEEDLRAFFETLVTSERGAPPANVGRKSGSDEADDTAEAPSRGHMSVRKSPRWVSRVRVIRDQDTQLGKGFAYVQFVDWECVDEILAMDPDSIKFAKRKLRVQRCKTVPGQRADKMKTESKDRSSEKSSPKAARQQGSRRPSLSMKSTSPKEVPVIPKGNPFLGQKLAGLSKEMRKQIKSSDKDRIARRVAKKKARATLAHTNVGIKESRPGVEKKDRMRQRATKSKEVNTGKKKGGARIRSDKAIAKMNMKKA